MLESIQYENLLWYDTMKIVDFSFKIAIPRNFLKRIFLNNINYYKPESKVAE